MKGMLLKRCAVIFLAVLWIVLSAYGCGASKKAADETAPGKFGEATTQQKEPSGKVKIEKKLFDSIKLEGKMIKWSSDALKIALEYPESYTLRVRPGTKDVVELTGPGEHDIEIVIMEEPEEMDPDKFIDAMKALFDRMDAQGYQEFERKFLDLNGSPAGYLDYKWNVMKRDFRTMRMDVLKDGTEYTFLTVYLLKNDPIFQEISRAVFNSIEILPGPIDLTAVKEEKVVGTGVPLYTTEANTDPPVEQETFNEPTANQVSIGTFAVTAKSTGEAEASAAILEEFGNKAVMADWNQVKSTYVTDFGAFFAENGIKDGEARWVTLDGAEFDGDRHYFIQRFDAGKPSDFGAIDSIGPIYLGSWYGIEMPSLILKK